MQSRSGRRRSVLRHLAFAFAAIVLTVTSGGCIHYVSEVCPTCRVLNPRHPGEPEPKLPSIRRRTRRLFVLVPGALGYNWEWTPAVARLANAPDTEFVVFWWEPYGTVKAAARALSRSVNDLITPLEPRALTEVIIVAHSMAGIVAAHAAPELSAPPGIHIKLVTIGTPFAGMIGPAFGYPDDTGSIALFSVFSPWLKYPRPADGLEIVEYRTTWPEDPVMEPRMGHDPAPPDIGPAPRRRVQLPHMDHNRCVDLVVQSLLETNDANPQN